MTTLTKYSPSASPVDSLINRLTREFFPAFDRVLSPAVPANGEWTAHRLPLTNINESKDAYVLTLEMPGLTRKEVELFIEGDVLRVRGERSQKIDEEGVIHSEIRSHVFERSFNLMPGVNRDNIRAAMKDGILTVTLAKAPEHVGRKIDVE